MPMYQAGFIDIIVLTMPDVFNKSFSINDDAVSKF
jgi:hypothetical protein